MQQLIKEFNRENLKPIIFIGVVLLLLAATAYPQRKFGGKVVEIVDGRTAVIQVPTGGRVTVVLQFIEVPEREQPLYQTVREHLQALILDKTVEFLPRRILTNASVGQIFLDGVDISQQMLRDGAAWYALPEKSAQEAGESTIYQTTEAQAKTEKRGVWSVENIKPAWEFRAEKQINALELEKAKSEMAALQTTLQSSASTVSQTVKPKARPTRALDMWSNVSNSSNAEETSTGNGLVTGSVPNTGIGYVMTSGDFYDFAGAGVKSRVESRSLYIYSSGQVVNGNGFAIGFLAESEKYSFAESNNLVVVADNQKLNLGKAYRLYRQMPYSVQEMLFYKTDAKTLTKIANAKTLEVKLGKYTGKLDADYQMRIKNLLAMTVN
ncbi:MAG TPA: thermonuclease family protein [Pyrinomonadaceae bacterium]|jgi:endonuclease YncB( thermonuclease family)